MLIFETSYSDYPVWSLVISFIFFILFINILLNRRLLKKLQRYYGNKYNKSFFAIVSFGLFFGFLFSGEPSDYWYSKQAIKTNNYLSLEGVVENFIPKKKCSSHTQESFFVKNIKFSYSNYDNSDAYYHKTKCENNFIKNNQRVKIYYLHIGDQNKIIKMWIL